MIEIGYRNGEDALKKGFDQNKIVKNNPALKVIASHSESSLTNCKPLNRY
jgi:hypothetical protein